MLLALLAENRLVTVTGMGGAGKTRLAFEAAARAAPGHGDGARFVGLAPVATADGIVAALGAAVPPGTLGGSSDPLAELTAALQPRELLLLVDNCEHLAADVAGVIEHLLARCPRLTVLATGREALHLPGERVVGLDPLPVDPCSIRRPSDAVRLFADRAAALRPGFLLDDSSVDDVVHICRLVDGIPLAVELAAARVAHLSPAEIARRLERQPGSLRSRQPMAADRHRTLASTLDWSFELLSDEEQAVFRRLAVFASSAALDAIEAVCFASDGDGVDVLEVVSSLVDKNLVVVEPRPDGSRYRMLNTVRRYAVDRLQGSDEEAATRRRHATWLARRADGHPGDHGDTPRTATVGDEVDDVVAALTWAIEADESELALTVAAGTWKRWEITGRHVEGRHLLARVLDDARPEPGGDRAQVLAAAASLALTGGDYAAARKGYEEAIGLLHELGLAAQLAGALNGLSAVALFEGELTAARGLAQEALQRFEALGDHEPEVAFARSTLGMIEARAGDASEAERHFLESLQVFRHLGRKREAASVLNNLGNLSADAGDSRRATRFYEGALQLQQEIGDTRGVALSLNNLCLAAQQRGNLDRAWEHAEAARASFADIGDRLGEAATTNNLANLAAERGQPAQAMELYAASAAAFREAGDARRLATALHNLADLAEGVGERQLAWDRLLDAVSLWNQLGQHGDVRAGLDKLVALADDWRVSGAERLAGLDNGEVDPVVVSHSLESARWVSIPPAPRVRPHVEELTPRESQVTGLVGRGFTNGEIAAQLFISERTVESHISNARMKLAVNSRTKLARWAIQRGLAD